MPIAMDSLESASSENIFPMCVGATRVLMKMLESRFAIRIKHQSVSSRPPLRTQIDTIIVQVQELSTFSYPHTFLFLVLSIRTLSFLH